MGELKGRMIKGLRRGGGGGGGKEGLVRGGCKGMVPLGGEDDRFVHKGHECVGARWIWV